MESELKYGSIDLIPISQIVARTKVRLQLKDISDYDQEIEMFINEAAMSLGSLSTFRKKNVRLDIVNGKAKLPCGFKKLHGVRMCMGDLVPNQSPQDVNSIYPFLDYQNDSGVIYLERTFFESCDSSCNNNVLEAQDVVEISGGYLRFPLPCPFKHCVLSYDGYATNECDGGIIEMHPQYERGFSEYARAMMLDTYPQLWNREWGNREIEVQRSYNTWVAQKDKLVSDAFATNYENNKYAVKRILHALLQVQNDPNEH